MGRWFTRIVLAVGIVAPASRSANLVLVPVDAFGRVLNGCSLESFRVVTGQNEQAREYKSHFHNLAGLELPHDRFEATIRCGNSLLNKKVLLSSNDQIELIARPERIMISEHVKPKLLIEMDSSHTSGEIWWVDFVGLYNGKRYLGPFDSRTGQFAVIDPDPGSYLVTIQSDKGYSCGEQVDFIEFSKRWKFDPAGCALLVDEYAHIVKGRSKDNDPWYPQMKLRIDQFFDELRAAARKQK